MTSPRPVLDGVLPLTALIAVAVAIPPLNGLAYAIAALYLTFAAGIATGGADRPGEPELPWRAYALGAALLAVLVPLGGLRPDLAFLELVPLGVMAIGFLAHVVLKLRHGAHRIGVLSACGRRAHDARVGRTVEAAALVLTAAALVEGIAAPALFAAGAWLLTAAAVAERPTSAREARPPAAAPAPAA